MKYLSNIICGTYFYHTITYLICLNIHVGIFLVVHLYLISGFCRYIDWFLHYLSIFYKRKNIICEIRILITMCYVLHYLLWTKVLTLTSIIIWFSRYFIAVFLNFGGSIAIILLVLSFYCVLYGLCTMSKIVSEKYTVHCCHQIVQIFVLFFLSVFCCAFGF